MMNEIQPHELGARMTIVFGGAMVVVGTIVDRYRLVEGPWVYDLKPDDGSAKRFDIRHDMLIPFDLSNRELVDLWLDL